MARKLTVHPLPLVKIQSVRGIFTYLINIAEPVECYGYMWYIEGCKEKILIDAGGTADGFTRRGYPASTVASPVEALKKVGLAPQDIDLVICTHLHFDHIEFAHTYRKATFIVQKEELAAALNPHPIQKASYLPKDMIEGLNFEVINGDKEIVEGVKVLFTPGHTMGGQSVMVSTSSGKLIISGLCTIQENFNPPESLKALMPVITTGHHIDAKESFKSLLKIKKNADLIIPLHDKEYASGKPIS